ncbi:MAG TPA: tRNA (adenosine(37)-N6)-dimethylallyltransferase MiaA [Candidatus Doudnabacteria bacterium]|nr:tRNA (adenosine(37)-N6)-dimethylallyltransferase MiaA [Candidatus Doudnabacteria bacterium]
MNKSKLIVVVGPTASGKSELAIKLAKKFDGEIISADSRQIYRGLDIGSGKVKGKWQKLNGKTAYVYKNIPHYLIDEVNPKTQFSVEKFQRRAQKLIDDILKRNKLPIICGGTMHWVDAIIFEQSLPKVKPNSKLRSQLSHLTPSEMFTMLKRLDSERAKTIDAKNPRRLIRALEIIKATGKPVPKQTQTSKYGTLWIGVKPNNVALDSKIKKRLRDRLKHGMIEEVVSLHKQGLSWKQLESFGLEYKYCALFLQNKLTREELEEQLFHAIRQYAKRQMTWWKRNADIQWIKIETEAMNLARRALE